MNSTWKDDAIAAYEAMVAEQRARNERQQRELEEEAKEKLANIASRVTRVLILPSQVDLRNGVPVLEFDGIRFIMPTPGDLCIEAVCEDCGREAYSHPITSHIGLGAVLSGKVLLMPHNCGEEPGDRNFRPSQPAPTLESRLVELLRELIREEIRQRE